MEQRPAIPRRTEEPSIPSILEGIESGDIPVEPPGTAAARRLADELGLTTEEAAAIDIDNITERKPGDD